MRIAIVAAMLVSSLFVAGTARAADSDDLKWVSQCLMDNAGATVSPEIVAAYCACMNAKMDSSETQTITQWEKSHATERKACEAAAGWK